MFRRGATRAAHSNHSGKATLSFACLRLGSPPVSTSEYLGDDTRSSVCAAIMEIKCKFLKVRFTLAEDFLCQTVMPLGK